MSSVYRAVHAGTGVEVAVKILAHNLSRNRTLLQRFLREAKSAEALEHPNIVAIYDHGVDHGRHYLVLEYVEGGDLQELVRGLGPMPVESAIAAIRSVAEGLEFAATRGLIHRDIKPANLLLTASGVVKIADLGLALQAEAEDERVTREGTTVGTVDYMSPEQARDSRGTSERSDIYSLGCTLFFLLTGQPPFPGGDVTEKLTRHFTAAPPDPAILRPETSAGCSALVRKMMAKKPENRFGNYRDLIGAIDALSFVSNAYPLASGRNDARADDPAQDGPRIPSADSNSDDASTISRSQGPVHSEIDYPGPVAFSPLDLSEDVESPDSTVEREPWPEVSMAELAALAQDEPHEEPATRVTRKTLPRSEGPINFTAVAVPLTRLIDAEPAASSEEDGALSGTQGPERAMSVEELNWLKTLVIGSVALVVAVIAFHQLYRATASGPVPSDTPPVAIQDLREPEISPPASRPSPPAFPPRIAVPLKAPAAKTRPALDQTPSIPIAWKEPDDPVAANIPEVEYGRDLEARMIPAWASTETHSQAAGKRVKVRRLADSHDANQKSNLGAALDMTGIGTVEVCDNGPFFEERLRVTGESRRVVARAGYRPVLCLISRRAEAALPQTALCEIEGRTLILEGLDLILDVKDLPRGLESVFLCRGGTLTLRNCSVTVVNRAATPFTLVKTATGDRKNRVHLERTLIQGAMTSGVELGGNNSEIFISRSVIVNGSGVGVHASGPGQLERRIYVSRSLIASSGPVVELSGGAAGSAQPRLTIRAMGSTFTRLPSPAPASLLTWTGEGRGSEEMFDWSGEDNTFAGWSGWLSTGRSRSIAVSGLAAARSVWVGTDSRSTETAELRSLVGSADRAGPSSLGKLAPERPGTVSRVGVPAPWLQEKTLGAFARPTVPGFSEASANTLPSVPVLPPSGPSPANPTVRDLVFDDATGPWSGDLGRFLAANVRVGDILVRVKVTGTMAHTWSPTRLPDGVSLEVVVTPGAGGRTPSWRASSTAPGEPLIDVRGGGLVLVGVNLRSEGPAAPESLVRVEGGHLVIHRSRLTTRSASETGAGGLIDFRAPGSRPVRPLTVQDVPWPFGVAADTPTCRLTDTVLIADGEVISAEVGRGTVALSNCAIAAGSSAFSLKPGRVARNRFEADLWLEHCTVASEHSILSLGPWRGGEPGPDRPWLVSSQGCGFFGTYERREQESVLLKADPDAFAHGVLFWQSNGDALELPRFTVSGNSPPQINPRPDVTHQWIDLWGRTHVRGATGPRPPGSAMTRRLLSRALRPRDVQAGDLFIDPAFPKDDPPRSIGADLGRLGISPTIRVPRPR